MSIAGIGSQGSGNLSQILSSLLTRLDTTSSSTNSTASQSDTSTTTAVASDGNLTGSTKPSLSSMILGVLMGMQNQSDTATTATASQDGTDPVSKLFTAMDSDSDGSVTKSELESYIQNAGGTADEADNLYSQLTTSDSGISQSDLASAAPPAPPPGGHGGHGGGPGGPPPSGGANGASGSGSIGSQMISELDSDDDGAISQSELTDYLTANGGTETDAQSLFASLSSDGSTSISATDIDNAIQKMASSFSSNPYASVLNMLDTYNAGTKTDSVSVSA